MDEWTTDEVVLLALSATPADDGDGVAPYEASILGISEVVGVQRGNVAARVSLLSTLSALERDGLVEKRTAPVEDEEGESLSGDRNVYRLTEAGRERARSLRQSIQEETVVFRNGTEREAPLREADQFFDEPALARALTRLTGDGVIYVEESVDDPFVDREAELGKLTDLLDPVRAGDPRFAFVTGEAGIGKTSLVEKLIEGASERGFEVAVGRCRNDVTEPYGAIREAFASLDVDDDPGDLFREADGEGLAAGIDGDPDAVEAGREALFYEVTDQIRSLTTDGPVVMFVDDLQWATRGTMDLLTYLGRNVTAVPLLLVGAYREEDVQAGHPMADLVLTFPVERRHRSRLDRFGVDETRELVHRIAGTRRVPDGFVDLVHERTGGNPLFVEESIQQLVATGTVDPEVGVYPESAAEMDTAAAVEATIDVRLSLLDEDSRAVLESASVVGESIDRDVLAGAIERPEPALLDHVEVLVGANVLERTDEDRLRFTSGVIRETVLDRLSDDRRRRLHRRVAEAILAVRDEELAGLHGQIADHFDRGGRPERAVEYYRKAGVQAQSVYAHRDAIDHYGVALNLARKVGSDRDVLSVLETLGDIHYLLGEYDEAIKHYEYVRDRTDDPPTKQRLFTNEANVRHNQSEYEEALELIDRGLDVEGGTDLERSKLVGIEGWIHIRTGDYETARERLERELELARSSGSDDRLAKAYHDRGAVGLFTDEFETALDYFEQALDLMDQDEPRRANTLNNMGIAYRKTGRLEAAIQRYEEALAIGNETNHEKVRANAISNLSVAYAQTGDVESAIEYGQRAREMADRIGDRMGVGQALGNLAKHYAARGEYERALDAYERGLEIFEDLGNRNYVALLLEGLGTAHRNLGNVEAAIETHERGIEVADEADDLHAAVTNRVGLANDYTADGDPETGLEYAETADELAEEVPNPSISVSAPVCLGIVLRDLGRDDRSRSVLSKAVDRSRRLEEPDKVAEAHLEFAKTLRETGELGLAREHASTALATARENGLTELVATIEEMLDELKDPSDTDWN